MLLKRRVLVFGPPMVLLVTAVVVGSLVLILQPDSSRTVSAQADRILILAADGEWELIPSALTARGARVVKSWSQLAGTVSDDTRAVVFTQDTLKLADPAWVHQKAREGTVIGGLGLSEAELVGAFGLNQPFSDEPSDPSAPQGAPSGQPLRPILTGDNFRNSSVPFFSLHMEVKGIGHISRSGMTERFISSEYFLAHAERYITKVDKARAARGD